MKKETMQEDPHVEETPVEGTKVNASRPTPTPTTEPTTTLKEAKKAASSNKPIQKDLPKKKDVPVVEVEESNDANEKVRRILSALDKKAVPTESISPTPTVEPTNTQQPGQFFAEIERMRELNQRRKKNKDIKEAIRKTSKKDH